MQLGRAWIAGHIPHHGDMCLLERVEDWDTGRIRCIAVSHRNPANPLRACGRLGAVCGIEYAAQAMAVHGALLTLGEASRGGRHGYLTSVRDVTLNVARLDDIHANLVVDAERLGGDERMVLYAFALHAEGMSLLAGRAGVLLDGTAVIPAGESGR